MKARIQHRRGWLTTIPWLAVLLLPWSNAASAQSQAPNSASRRVSVHVESVARACPGHELLDAALRPVFVDATITRASALDPTTSDVAVRDLGDSYEITAGAATRTVSDPARDCVERARVTAVFAALNLHAVPPAQATATDTASTETSARDDATDPAATDEPPARRDALAVAVMGSVQLPSSHGELTGGAGLGVAWISNAWRLGVDATWLSSSAQRLHGDALSTVPDARVSTTRLPLALSATHLFSLGALSIGPSLGVALDVLWLRGEQVRRPQNETRLNVGARLALDGRVHLSRTWHGVFQLHAWGYPRAYKLRVDPSGESGSTPRLWFGANLGLECLFGEFDTAH